METGIGLIASERQEHLSKHQQTILDDVHFNPNGELVEGAIRLLQEQEPPQNWDVERFYKMRMKPLKERIVIAASLLAADLDRRIYLEKLEQRS